jgi:arginase
VKPIIIFAPYWMGKFSPSRAAQARHTWRLLTAAPVEGTPTQQMGVLCRALADEVAAVRADGNLPVAMVGDCTFSIGVAAGLQRDTSDFALIWYDSHGDFNTHQTTPSGFIGGMPLAMLCGRGEQTILQGAGAAVHPEAEVILTDARDLDPGEAEAVAESAVVHLPQVADLLTYPLPDKPLYVHLDLDVLQLSDLPAVSYPAAGGPALNTVAESLTRLAQTGRLAAVSVTMWNPELDEDGSAETVGMGLVEQLVDAL